LKEKCQNTFDYVCKGQERVEKLIDVENQKSIKDCQKQELIKEKALLEQKVAFLEEQVLDFKKKM